MFDDCLNELISEAHRLHEAAAIVLVGKAYIGLAVASEPSNWGDRRQHGSLHVSHRQTWVLGCHQCRSTCSQTQHQQIHCIWLAACATCICDSQMPQMLLTNNVTTGDRKDVRAAAVQEDVCI